MSKIITEIIENCLDCKWSQHYASGCWHCLLLNKRNLGDVSVIPNWCPLENSTNAEDQRTDIQQLKAKIAALVKEHKGSAEFFQREKGVNGYMDLVQQLSAV